MLYINNKLCQKGFSLIELMVAVVILAMVIFGIFLAFTTGFQGMADARDRTVATNYAQEAMEDIKNIDFDQIIPQSRAFISGTKFEREVIVPPQESPNLKEVTTKVYWKNRNGTTWDMVETSMVIHFIETTAGAATRIILIADPYNVLTEDYDDTTIYENRSIVTAVIKDIKGNTVTTWTGNVTFSIDSGSGSFADDSTMTSIIVPVTTVKKGIASTTFYASTEEGTVNITASATELTPGSVTLKVTDPDKPVKINLTASPVFMTLGSISTITATIINAGGEVVENATNEITFSVSNPDLGTLSNQSPLILGIKTIDLNSTTTKGTITVTASASGLEPGVINVITGGQISLSAFPSTVNNQEKSEITVTTKDVNGVPINYVGDIQLNISPNPVGSGTFEDNSSTTIIIYFDGFNPSKNITFVASIEGSVIINTTDQEGILDSGSITLNIIEPLIPDYIKVTAEPPNIKIGGSSSIITAVIKTSIENGNKTVTSYNGPVIFATTHGELTSVYANFVDGKAIATLYSSDTAETAIITVSSSDSLTGSIEVGFYIEANNIHLRADPQNILAGGEICTITATIKDGETTVSGYKGPVTFTIITGYPSGVKFTSTNQSSITTYAEAGVATVDLQSKNWVGTAKIKAVASDGIPYLEKYLNIPVGINLELVENSVIYDFNSGTGIGTVSFNIDVQGAVLLLEEMQVSWYSPAGETINIVEIRSPSTADPAVIVFNNSTDPVSSGELIDVIDSTLSTGISNIKIYFNANMAEKNILDVTFNPNSGDYTVHLKP